MQRYLIIAAVVLVVVAYMTTDTVRFTETAVVTTFGRAGEDDVVKEPGVLVTWPWAQRVTKYDNRARFLETRPETVQTGDDKQIAATAFVTWKVDDALKFYQRFSGSGSRAEDHYREAEKTIRSKLRSAMNEIGRYRLDELLSSRPGASRLAELEARMLAALKSGAAGDASLADYGIEPLFVGFSAITFPQETTREVFKAMSAERARVANEADSQGKSRAQTIVQNAKSDAERITAFAQVLADRIRGQGEQEAAQYVAEMNDDPALAIFLQNMNFIREAFGRSTTLVLPTNMPGMEMFRTDAFKRLTGGRPPTAAIDAAAAAAAQGEQPR